MTVSCQNKCFTSFIIILLLSVLLLGLFGYVWSNAFKQSCVPYLDADYQQFLKSPQPPISIQQHRNSQLIQYIYPKHHQFGAKGANQVVAVVDLPVKVHRDFKDKLIKKVDIHREWIQNIHENAKLTSAIINSHGSQIVGLINGYSVGIAPYAVVLPIPINKEGYYDADTVVFAKATQFAIDHHIVVINQANTWGSEILFYGETPSGQIYDPYHILKSIKQSNAILVLSAGNQGVDFTIELNKGSEEYGSILNQPEVLSHLLYVGVYDIRNKRITDFSNYPGVNSALQQRFISVPNIDLTSTVGNKDFQTSLVGTSYASAIVSAALAVLMGEDITLSSVQAADILLETATTPCLTKRPDCESKYIGQGMLNLDAALDTVILRKQKFWYPVYRAITRSRKKYLCKMS